MRFEYTGRHVEVSPAIRSHVEDHFKKLAHIFNDATASTHVIIDVEKNRHIGELIVHWRDHTLTAKDINADMYMSLTRAIAKIENKGQCRRRQWRQSLMDNWKPHRVLRESSPRVVIRLSP